MALGISKKFYNVLHGFGHKNGVSGKMFDLKKNLRRFKMDKKDRIPEKIKDWFFDAVKYGKEEATTWFLDHGIDIETRDEEDDTALLVCLKEEEIELAKVLINRGANVNVKGRWNSTALHITEDINIAKILLKKGANINAKDEDGETPLYIAVNSGDRNIDYIKFLLENGADIEIKNEDGKTPLMVAEEDGNEAIIELLKNSKKQKASKAGQKCQT